MYLGALSNKVWKNLGLPTLKKCEKQYELQIIGVFANTWYGSDTTV
jgi:hypothetical protein